MFPANPKMEEMWQAAFRERYTKFADEIGDLEKGAMLREQRYKTLAEKIKRHGLRPHERKMFEHFTEVARQEHEALTAFGEQYLAVE